MQAKFARETEQLSDGEEILFLVDVYGGTPYNAAAQVVYGRAFADILTGVNLPMVLEAAINKNQLSLVDLVNHLQRVAREGIKCFTEEMNHVQIMDNEEDLL
ncbi:PTS sugar transporter subunit IIA [Listeria innocua]